MLSAKSVKAKAKAKAKLTTVEWSDESCHLSEKQMKAMGFGSTHEMMEHYYDCKPSDTKHEMLNKSVKAMKCVLGRIDRMLRRPVTPNDANSGLYDSERDSHLYQIVLAFLYGKKCLKNALNNLDDSQLDAIIGIYTSLVNDAFNEAPMNPRIRNLRPIEEEGPEGVYHQLHEGRFSIDHLIDYLKKQKVRDVRNPRILVDDPVINGILLSMDILVSNPEITIEDPRIIGNMLYDAFERVTHKFHEFRARSTGEVLRYKDDAWAEPENENDELAIALAASSLAKAPVAEDGAGSGGPAKAPVAEDGAGSGGPAKAPVAEGGAGSGGPAKAPLAEGAAAVIGSGTPVKAFPKIKSGIVEENFNNILKNFRKANAAKAAMAPSPVAATLMLTPFQLAEANPEIVKISYDYVNQIILSNFGTDTIQNVDISRLPPKRDGRIHFEYELSIQVVVDTMLGLFYNVSINVVKKKVPDGYPKGFGIYKGYGNTYYYRALKPLVPIKISTITEAELEALNVVLILDRLRSNPKGTKRLPKKLSSGRRRTRKHLH